MFAIRFSACKISFKLPYWLECLNCKRMSLSQTVRQMMDNLQKSKLFFMPWEKGQNCPCPEGTKQKVFNISETHKLRRKTWARQESRDSLTTLSSVPIKEAITWWSRLVKVFFALVQWRTLFCRYLSKIGLGAIRLKIMTNETLQWECYLYAWIS